MTTSKIAIITGGSRGLGANIALHLAKRGVDSIITYKSNATEAAKVVAQVSAIANRKAVALQLDAGDTKQFDAFVTRVQETLASTGRDKFDFLVHNAGVGLGATIAQTTEAQFDELMSCHFRGPFFLTQKLLPILNDGGAILSISTGLTRFSMSGYGAYASMKGALEVMTRYLAVELGARKIRANILAPGAIETDFGGGHVRDNANINKFIAGQTPLGRVGVPDDIGSAAAALLLDCGWVNGQRIEASGGIHG